MTQEIRPIRFVHRGQVVETVPTASTRTVLEWLREDAHCTGTKEGCGEGDCGACTVVIGELQGDQLALNTVNACIQFLPTLDGKALFTVEDVRQGASLHPVQQAMVECHGSQCGFCTPGFVMSLWSCWQEHRAAGTRPSRQELADELSGNLCRCTGYRPILDAGERMFDIDAPTFDAAPVVAALKQLETAQPLARPGFWAPRTLEEFARLREAHPTARLLAGSTDIGLWVTKQFRELGDLLYIGNVAELRTVEERDGFLHIGAAASLEDAWQALVERWPSLRDLWLRFASLPIRHAGTMGGNVANGSPIGDSPPVLMALDASIVLRKGASQREMPLASFYLDYMKSELQPGEFVEALRVPLPGVETVRAYKISKRFDCDISAISCGLAIELQGDVVRVARFAFGGMAATVKRAASVEAEIVGRRWTKETVEAAQRALERDFKPLSDMRASASYRMQVAQNLLMRFWLETRVADALPLSAVSVFAREEV